MKWIYGAAQQAIEKTLTARGAAIASCGVGVQQFTFTTSGSTAHLHATSKGRFGRCVSAVNLGKATPGLPSYARVAVTVRATVRYY